MSTEASTNSVPPPISGMRLARNASAMMAAQLLTWAMAFLVAIFQPRILGPLAIGQLSIALSIWMIAGVLITFGMDTFLMKAVAREPQRTGVLIGTSMLVRVGLWTVSCLVVFGYDLTVISADPTQTALIWIIGLMTLFSVLSGGLIAALNGLEQTHYASLVTVISKVVLTAVSLALLFAGFDVIWIGWANVLAAFVAFLGDAFFLFRQHQPRWSIDLVAARQMLLESKQYLVTALTLMVYQQVDRLFIALFASTEAVGWYGTAVNLFGTLMFFPVAIGTVIFPTLTRRFAAGQDYLRQAVRPIFNIMLALSMPIGLGLLALAEPIALLLYGEAFRPTGAVLAVMGLVLICTYLNTVLSQLLIAAERTAVLNIIMIAATVATLPLDFVLVPWTDQAFDNGALGGALAYTITELGILVAAIMTLPKGTLGTQNWRVAVLTGVAGIGMVAAIWWLRATTFFLLGVPLGAVVYIGLVLAFRALPNEEMTLIKDALVKVLERLPFVRRRLGRVGVG
ncbi:MAG: flippase [Chloroflexus aggregans]|uniref:Flippase n=1 Tax=Chloroflexus aggregans TaxID=152260 RepID=A0A2J6WQL7_9CHLR|nr:MAG: flippase [Chloroflexus aggregans]